jgi:hypothetical protein
MNLDIKKTSESKVVRDIIIIIGVIIVVLGILRVGISLGERRARFAGAFGDNFERNFIGQRGGMGMVGGFFNEGLPGGHGAVGNILSISLPQMIITGPDNLEKTIIVGTSTIIRQFQKDIKSINLKVGDFVTIIGNPNDNGQVEAKLIRVMPNPGTKPQ